MYGWEVEAEPRAVVAVARPPRLERLHDAVAPTMLQLRPQSEFAVTVAEHRSCKSTCLVEATGDVRELTLDVTRG